MKKLTLILSLLIFCSVAYGQSDPQLLTLERIFSSGEFNQERFGPARWIEEGNAYTTLESAPEYSGSREIIRYETATGARSVLVPAQRLIPPGQQRPLGISNYIWSPDKKKMLIFTNTVRVWRTNTKGDYWVLDLEDWSLKQLGADMKASTLMFAKFSPDNSKVGYVQQHNIYVENLKTGNITQLTRDGSVKIINGTFDWAYEEELGQQDGFRWSPDSKNIAYWQLDANGIRDFLMINNTDSTYSYTIPIQYPKVGTDGSAAKIGVVSATGGATRWMKIEGDPRQHYLARMDWADNDQLIVQQLNRKQNTNKVMLTNATNGTVSLVMTDKDEAWVQLHRDLNWIKKGKAFTWVSERDGWKHIYEVSRSGEVKSLTPWDFDVVSIEHLDEKKGWVYYIASPNNATQRYLYRSRLNGKGKAERLTPLGDSGTHSYQISPDARWAIHTYSSFGQPQTIDLISLPDHTVQRVLAANKRVMQVVSELAKTPAEFFKVDIGEGITMDAYMVKPHDFNPSKKYPVLFHVYGEPAGQTVLDRWGGSGYLWHAMLAQQGYIIISMDNRGTPAPKGRAWRKSVYGQIGILASHDQAKGAQEVIKRFDFIDKDRIGIWGWSGGGSMTLNMMFRYPEIYKTGMSVAPVGNQLLYDNIYQERYMGLPWENAENYKNGSPFTHAKNLEGNLLIVHGTGDDNVHYQNAEVVINELIKHNKYFSMMAYPNRSHGIYEGVNTSRHLRELLTRYLKEHLEPGPKTR
jgi:dipeptidyl-peptidase-4